MSNAKKCLALPDSNRSPLAGDGQLAVRVPNAESIAIKHEYESPPMFSNGSQQNRRLDCR